MKTHAKTRRDSRRRGAVVFDSFVGLVLITAMVTALATTAGQQRRVAGRLAAEREALRVLEAAAAAMELGGDIAESGVTIETVDARWCRLSLSYAGGTAELFVGLPEGGLP